MTGVYNLQNRQGHKRTEDLLQNKETRDKQWNAACVLELDSLL